MKFIIPLFITGIVGLLASHNLEGQVNSVEGVVIPVSSIERSLPFYRDILGFTVVSDTEVSGRDEEILEGLFGLRKRIVCLRLGDEQIALVDYLTAGGEPIALSWKSNDLIFQHVAIVVSNMDSAFAKLHRYGVEQVSTAPQTLPPSIPEASGVKAFYFHDPDRHNLELIWFPEGKGQEKWHRKQGGLFLGIDHTAIAIANTSESLTFYRDFLGIEPRGESWNKGTEQEHLNNIEEASLHITGLRTGAGPGIEFLQYLRPSGGRPYPVPSKTDDLWSWQTVVRVRNLHTIFEEAQKAGYTVLSRQLAKVPDSFGPLSVEAFLLRDPDGHLVRIEADSSRL